MGKKILLADDSITIQKVIELTFSDEDFEVVTVGNGRLAIEKVQEVRPDVVLCDVIMPEKDGYEVCDFIKKSPQFGQVPVLLLTGAFEPFDQERAARVGCDGFLAKPFEPETLIAKVKDLLSKAAARQTSPLPSPRLTGPVAPVPAPVAPAPFAPAPFAVPPAAGRSGPFSTAGSPAAFAPPPPPTRVEEPEMAFIPDEPFEDLDAPAAATSPGFVSPLAPPSSAAPVVAPFEQTVEDLLPITAEESEALAPGDDASSTVMFNAGALPWSTPAAAPTLKAASAAAPEAPAFAAEHLPEMPLFEEMIEETEVDTSSASSVLMADDAFSAPASTPAMAPSLKPPPAPFSPPAFSPAPAEHPQPPPFSAARLPAPPPDLSSPRGPERHETPPADASSFADVAAVMPEPEPEPVRPSIAAQVDVPVDMVAQIAQRVVAQVSEKIVERIVWEVVPDLAEAMIKREIERLKAELQQLG